MSVARIAVVAVGLLYPLIFRAPFPQHVMIMVFVFAALGEAWNILGGFAGQTSLGHSAFFGIGAYTSTMLMVHLNVSPWIGMIAGMVLASLIAALIGYGCFRFHGFYLAIATICLGLAAQQIAMNWTWIGGAIGIFFPLKPESFVNFQFHSSKLPYYYIAFALFGLVYIAVTAIDRNKIGYYLRAISTDEDAARSLGVDILKYKQLALCVSAAFTAMMGTFYAQYVLFIDPGSVMAHTLSIQIVLITVLGGAGTTLGPLIGAIVLIPISELSRACLGGGGRGIDLVIYGVLIVAMSIMQPGGLMSWISESKWWPARRAVGN